MICPLRHDRGFSLVELLFSISIGAIILLATGAVLVASGEHYETISGGVATEREARAALRQLASDLSSACFHQDGVFDESGAPWPADRIGVLSLQAPDAQSEAGRVGDLCAVSYYVGDLVSGGRTVRCLMRGFRESGETFRAIKGGEVPSLFEARGGIDEPVAFGVVSFEVRAKTRGESGEWEDWRRNDITGPDALHVRLVIARREIQGRLTKPADWDGTGRAMSWLGAPSEAGRNKNLEVYETTIRFGNEAH
jgi:prepilin-type N-terminal cleavage/methylation domain-containing protein